MKQTITANKNGSPFQTGFVIYIKSLINTKIRLCLIASFHLTSLKLLILLIFYLSDVQEQLKLKIVNILVLNGFLVL